MKKSIGLLGRNITYSLSPKLQGAAFAAAGLDWEYLLLATEPENLGITLDKLREPNWAGANVTVPYKQLVIPMLDAVAASAVKICAVNTIVNNQGRLTGHNTDCSGLARDLERLGICLDNRDVVILGAGGGAAAALALMEHSRVNLVCRNQDQALALVQKQGNSAGILPWHQAPGCDVLINCTPPNSGWKQLASKAEIIYDLNYYDSNPPQGKYYCGLGMLLFQGAEAFHLWTGLDPSLDEMARALGLRL